VAAGLLQHLGARLLEEDLAPDRVLLERGGGELLLDARPSSALVRIERAPLAASFNAYSTATSLRIATGTTSVARPSFFALSAGCSCR